jgi:hypothetical protein
MRALMKTHPFAKFRTIHSSYSRIAVTWKSNLKSVMEWENAAHGTTYAGMGLIVRTTIAAAP